MPNCIYKFQKAFPTICLVVSGACFFIISMAFILLPAHRAEAVSNDAPKALPLTVVSVSAQPFISIKPDNVTATTAPTENWVTYEAGPGDNLTSIFKKAGLSNQDVYRVAKAGKQQQSFTRIYPGQQFSFLIKNGELSQLKYIKSPLESTHLISDGTSYTIKNIIREPKVSHKYTSGIIKDSLFLAGDEAGLSSKKIMELSSIFGWDIDFVLDIRKGDSFSLIYEEHFLDGKKISEGPIIAAQFHNRGKKYTALRYTTLDGDSNYYTPEGFSMRKTFLRSPVDFARISSRFNLKRKHPVLNRIRAHKGVDYAASTGTPIKAAGDGKIIFRGRKGGYGKVVILQHGNNITTLYAHMNNFKRGHKVGTRVKQGQTIGFVGQTGLATGSHLHYEFQLNGVHKNPLSVKLPQAAPIAKSEYNAFKAATSIILAQLETHNATTLAANSASAK
ncbi:MAG: peptidase M23 [Neptuniibacter caesariensis]|uniref:Peptidase M23 n=1 Tax=Neptuniibacter caesariensis TaxID=207954 RepID=A0A2G6JBL6_NEPCE|nr:MAG: peptidase M23 [Neptuniibacter caesariensis]